MTLEQAVDELLTQSEFVLGIDFDGTLAPLVEHPDLAVPDARALEALRTLATRTGISVAVVSGRSHAALKERLGDVEGVVYIGEHGNDTGGAALLIDTAVVVEMGELVDAVARETPGSVTERKTRSVTFHYRSVSAGVSAPALEEIRDWVSRHPEVTVIEGKNVVELTTAHRNKGDAIMEMAGAHRVIYIGDDTTDESVFAVLRPGDVGVKVGDGETAAEFRVEDVAAVVAILEQMVLASR